MVDEVIDLKKKEIHVNDVKSMDSSLMCQFKRDGPKWFEEQRCRHDTLACRGNCTPGGGPKREDWGVGM